MITLVRLFDDIVLYVSQGSYPHAEQFYYCQSKFNIGYVPTENPFKRLATHAARRASIVVLRGK